MHSRELLDKGEIRMKMETYRDQWQGGKVTPQVVKVLLLFPSLDVMHRMTCVYRYQL